MTREVEVEEGGWCCEVGGRRGRVQWEERKAGARGRRRGRGKRRMHEAEQVLQGQTISIMKRDEAERREELRVMLQ